MKKLVHVVVLRVGKFIGNRWTGLFVSAVLIATASVEVFESVFEIRAHHGLLVYGLSNLFRTLPEFFHGATIFEEVESAR